MFMHVSQYSNKAPKAWQDKIDIYFLKNGLKLYKYGPNMYVKNFDDDFLIVVLYVDDIILTGIQLALIHELKNNLNHQFEMTDLGLLHYFLGLQILHMVDGIFLS